MRITLAGNLISLISQAKHVRTSPPFRNLRFHVYTYRTPCRISGKYRGFHSLNFKAQLSWCCALSERYRIIIYIYIYIDVPGLQESRYRRVKERGKKKREKLGEKSWRRRVNTIGGSLEEISIPVFNVCDGETQERRLEPRKGLDGNPGTNVASANRVEIYI